MKIVHILTITTGANAWSFGRWKNGEYVFDEYVNRNHVGCNHDYCGYGDVTTTASTNTEELTTTLEPERMFTTTDEELLLHIKITTMTSTELTSASDELVGDWWSAAWSSLPCYITELTFECASTDLPSTS